MLKKIILFGLIVVVTWLLFTFVNPELSKKIETTLWIEGTTETIKWVRDDFNTSITETPTLWTLEETYDEVYNGAVEIKNTVTGWIETTKETIDTVRSTLSWAEETYNQAKDWLNQVKETLDKTSEAFDKIKGTIDSVEKITWWWE